jgi:hypothetical protein
MPSRSIRDQKGNKEAQWPPQVWPPVAQDVEIVPPPDPGDDVPDLSVGGTPWDRALAMLETSLLVDEATVPDSPYLKDPIGWIDSVLGEFAWSKQRQIANSVATIRRTAVPSAHETGKSWLAARIISWWLSVHKPGEAFAVTTAPSASQVRAILWREINRAHRKGNLPGRTNQTEWWIGDELVAFGRKPADYSPTAFQGIHARYVLVVIDEACGVPAEIFRAAQSLVANENGRMLAIGNPDDPSSHFAVICGPDSGWNVIPVSAFDTPNFTGEEIPEDLRELLVSHIYTDELAADVGTDSPVYVSKALGQFPENAANGVIPLSMIRACQNLDREWTYQQMMPVELGMDVGAGGDQTVIRERRGPVAGRTWRKNTPNWSDAVALAMDAIRETGASAIKIDIIGIGWGVVGRLRELRRQGKHACDVIGVNVGTSSTNQDRFPKLRDQLWWEIGRELSRARAWDLSAVDDTVVNQMIQVQWEPDSAGRIHVEPKKKTIERIKRSPDDADALLLAYFKPVLSKPFVGASGGNRPIITAAQMGAGGKLLIPAGGRRRRGNVVAFRAAGPDGRPLPNPYRTPRRSTG